MNLIAVISNNIQRKQSADFQCGGKRNALSTKPNYFITVTSVNVCGRNVLWYCF